jgi:hypothetical protein
LHNSENVIEITANHSDIAKAAVACFLCAVTYQDLPGPSTTYQDLPYTFRALSEGGVKKVNRVDSLILGAVN